MDPTARLGGLKKIAVVEIDKKEVVMTSERAYRAVAVGRTGKGGYGHGLHLAYENLGNVEITAVADEDEEGRRQAQEATGAPRAFAD